MTETTFIDACRKGDIKTLREMSLGRKKLSAKSRSKEFDNLFQRGLFEILSSNREKELAQILCAWCEDVNSAITEKQIMSILAKGRYDVLDELLNAGLALDKPSFEAKYKSVLDKMFKTSIRFARIEDIKYLMSVFNIELIDVSGIIRWLANEEEMAALIDRKLVDKGCSTLLNFLMENGVSMDQIISVLN